MAKTVETTQSRTNTTSQVITADDREAGDTGGIKPPNGVSEPTGAPNDSAHCGSTPLGEHQNRIKAGKCTGSRAGWSRKSSSSASEQQGPKTPRRKRQRRIRRHETRRRSGEIPRDFLAFPARN